MVRRWRSVSRTALVLLLSNYVLICSRAQDEENYVPPTIWTKYEIPNPRTDVWKCGRGGTISHLCDPNEILTRYQANEVDYLLEDFLTIGGCHCDNYDDCPSDYGGYPAGVVMLNKMDISITNASVNDKLSIAADYAHYIRAQSWKFGRCDDDLLILVSKEDGVVYTRTGSLLRVTLTNECTENIFEENQQLFTNGDFGAGTVKLLQEYRKVLMGRRYCKDMTLYIVLGVLSGAVFIGILGILLCICCCGCCKSGGGGGGGRSYGRSLSWGGGWGGRGGDGWGGGDGDGAGDL